MAQMLIKILATAACPPKNVPRMFARNDLGDETLPGIGSKSASKSLPDEQKECQDEGFLRSKLVHEPGDQSETDEWDSLVNRHRQNERFVPPQTG